MATFSMTAIRCASSDKGFYGYQDTLRLFVVNWIHHSRGGRQIHCAFSVIVLAKNFVCKHVRTHVGMLR